MTPELIASRRAAASIAALTGLCPNAGRAWSGLGHSEDVRSSVTAPDTDLPIRTRLLRELERDGASGEFLRQYFLCRGDLTSDDLRVLWDAVVRRTQGHTSGHAQLTI